LDIDLDAGTIRVGDFVYALDILADGLETPPGKGCSISKSEPAADGSRQVLFTLVEAQP
jgi:hypothetical protein